MTVHALQARGEPSSLLYRVLHRIADRLAPEIETAFLAAIGRIKAQIDTPGLERAIRTRRGEVVLRRTLIDQLDSDAILRRDLEDVLGRIVMSVGTAVGETLAREIAGPSRFNQQAGEGVAFAFDVQNPRAVQLAAIEAARLVSGISSESVAALREIVADIIRGGMNPRDGAARIRAVVGLRSQHGQAVANLGDLLGQARTLPPDAPATAVRDLERRIVNRRLDAVTKQRLRSAIRNRAVTQELIEETTDIYSDSLLNRRALDIARTESLRSSNAAQQETYRQAAESGAIDSDRARRVAIVTPDDRLRPSHAAVPGLNPDGVRIDEPFEMPDGSTSMFPPWDFDPVNCRCTTGLTFTGRPGVL